MTPASADTVTTASTEQASSRPPIALVFIGQNNFYTEFLIDWMSQIVDVRGVIWTSSDRHTWQFRWRRWRQRLKRGGLRRAASEVLFHLYSRLRYPHDARDLRQLVQQGRDEWQVPHRDVPALEVVNLKDRRVAAFLAEHRPDMLFTQCINELIPPAVFEFPSLGCYVFHEGVVPKYRGKFCTHWAIHNGDFDCIGATVLRVDRGFDSGSVAFVEPVYVHASGRGHGWLEHETLFLALPRLKSWLEDLGRGKLQLSDQGEQFPIYSYPTADHLFGAEAHKAAYDRWRQERERP